MEGENAEAAQGKKMSIQDAEKVRNAANIINRFFHDKSPDEWAEENQNRDFQRGFQAGFDSTDGPDEWKEWMLEWDRRDHIDSPGWKEWKRGWHAGRWERVAKSHEESGE